MTRAGWIHHLLLAGFAVTLSATSSAQALFVDMSREDLVRAVPELSNIQFDSNRMPPETLLRSTGAALADMFGRFAHADVLEAVEDVRFESVLAETSRREQYVYSVDAAAGDGQLYLRESRGDPKSGVKLPQPQADDGRFLERLSILLPQNQTRYRFASIGRLQTGGREIAVLAFAANDSGHRPSQGLVWIDVATGAVVRLRAREDSTLSTTDIVYAAVRTGSRAPIWLPAKAITHYSESGMDAHRGHRFSGYRVDDQVAANPSDLPAGAEDACELLAQSMSAGDDTAKALSLLREALRIDPEPRVLYQLAAALVKTGDLAGAETQLQIAAERAPGIGPVHNLLGLVLAKRRDLKRAAVEFREAARLQPDDAIVRFNLGQVLEAQGDRDGAVEAYRLAAKLDPQNDTYRERHDRLARQTAPAPAPDTARIHVEVRQVLVPVVVTDHDGNYVTGLTRDDFQVFEDGVEQKIAAFSVDTATSGSSSAESTATPLAPASEPPGGPRPRQLRRTYVICIDTLHADPANLMRAREALAAVFRSEQPGDAQYVLVAVGRETRILRNTTPDIGSVLDTIRAREFEKLYTSKAVGTEHDEYERYRREVEEARAACDSRDGTCQSRVRQLRSRAGQVAEEQRFDTTVFLRQLRSLVQQLARANDRRTIILLSDGFGMVPGKEAFELFAACFPEFPEARYSSVRANDHMQDELSPVLQLAANNNIVFQTIDTRGLYTQAFFAARYGGRTGRTAPVLAAMNRSASDAGSTLVEIAEATGGTAFRNSNDLAHGMRRALSDGREYYTLAYVPENAVQDRKFRAISVRLRNNPKLNVNAKRGYWAGPDPAPAN